MAKILIVDDHGPNRALIVPLLGYDGHQALEAADGAEALAIVRAELPQLVICDILMPTMDGYEFVRQLRSDPTIAATEVMFYTATYHEREARNLATLLGVSRILVKPCAPEAIIAAIDEALARAPRPPPVVPNSDFDQEHQRVLTDKLAAQVEELERANQRLATLTELNLQLSVERDAHALLDKLCQGTRALTGARYGILCIAAKTNIRTVCFVGYGFSREEMARLSSPAIDQGVFGRVMAERKSIRFLNPDGRPEGIGLPYGFPPVHCGVAAPIASTRSVFGWVCLLDKVGATEFTEDDEWVSSAHAAQAGRIYENRDLYAQLERRAADLVAEMRDRKRAEQQLQRVVRARNVMAECNRTLVRATDELQLLDDMCRFLVERGNYGMTWVGLVRHDAARTIETVASAGDHTGMLKTARISWADNALGRGPAGVAVRSGKPKVVHDIACDPALSRWRDVAREHGFNAAAALPLICEGETLGVMCIVAREVAAFDADEVELLAELADDIAYGIHTLRARMVPQRTDGELGSSLLKNADVVMHRAKELGLSLARPAGQASRALLIVDHEASVVSALERLLRPDGYHILTANSGAEALELLARNDVQVIIADQRMPHMSGTEFLARTWQMYPDTIRIMLTGQVDVASVTDAINRGAVLKFLTKPWDDELLRKHIEDAFRYHASSRTA